MFGIVEALLDELDSAVAPTPAPVVEKRSVVGRSGVLNENQPSKTGKYRTQFLCSLLHNILFFVFVHVSFIFDCLIPWIDIHP